MNDSMLSRERRLLQTHPELRNLITYSPVVHQWFKQWVRGSKSIEAGMMELVSLLVKHNIEIRNEFAKKLDSKPYPIIDIKEV